MSQYPQSTYDEIIHNMAAEIYYSLYQKDKDLDYFQKAQKEYQYLLAKYPFSPLAERTELFLGYSSLERDDGISGLQSFQRFLEKYPDSKYKDEVRRAIAAVYLLLEKYDDASRVYKELSAGAKDRAISSEAVYRLGDVSFAQRDYDQAIELYQKALKSIPEMSDHFPNGLYNLAESYFWRGDYRLSLDTFIRFLKSFPTHDHSGYALTRIGEIMEIMGVDQSRVMGAYLECFFRFHGNPGAGVARVRMLSRQMKGMKSKELKKSVEEMKEISVRSELPRMDEFMNLMVADGLHHRGEYEEALRYLVSYFQKHPTSSSLPFFHKRILKNIADQLADMVEKENYMDVLSKFSQYSATWLKNPDRMDIPYFLGRAYEQAGVFAEAGKIYSELLKELEKIRGTREEKERRVNEHLPSFDELNLRLSSISLMARDVSAALRFLEKIKDSPSLNSGLQIELVGNLAKVAEETGQPKQAIQYLLKLIESWKESPEQLAPVYLRLAEMQIKNKQWPEAEFSLDKIGEFKKQGVPIADPIWVSSLENRGNV
ncbi:MAG: tetratricopeptide repeat protein, partial [Bdellovibrionales bacterium]|nr:tetratricopeptide repeat protein [Bdellovibrionales bacterium]